MIKLTLYRCTCTGNVPARHRPGGQTRWYPYYRAIQCSPDAPVQHFPTPAHWTKL
jgi:hypothetical protein